MRERGGRERRESDRGRGREKERWGEGRWRERKRREKGAVVIENDLEKRINR
jgi:hypothetical protein